MGAARFGMLSVLAVAACASPSTVLTRQPSPPRSLPSSAAPRATSSTPIPSAPDAPSEGARLVVSNDESEATRGATWIDDHGTPADAPALARGIDLALARRPKDFDPRRGPVAQSLFSMMSAARSLTYRGLEPKGSPKTKGELLVWVVARYHVTMGPSSKSWDDLSVKAMSDEDPYIVHQAIDHLPMNYSEALVPVLEKSLTRPEIEIVVSTCRRSIWSHRLAPAVLSLLRTATDDSILENCYGAVRDMGRRYESAEILVERITEPDIGLEVLTILTTLLEPYKKLTNTGGATTPPKAAIHQKHWRALLTKHRADIEAGKLIPLDKNTPRDLLPPGWVDKMR